MFRNTNATADLDKQQEKIESAGSDFGSKQTSRNSRLRQWTDRLLIKTAVVVAFVSIFSVPAAAQNAGFICNAAPNSLITLVQNGSRLFVSVAALGMAASYVISLGSESMPLLNQEQEQKFKRMRGNSLRTFMKLIVGLVGLQVVFSALGILGCMNFIPI